MKTLLVLVVSALSMLQIAIPNVFAKDYVRCSDAEKLCEGYKLQESAANSFCNGGNGVCETALSICPQAMNMCSSLREMQIEAKTLCETFRGLCK